MNPAEDLSAIEHLWCYQDRLRCCQVASYSDEYVDACGGGGVAIACKRGSNCFGEAIRYDVLSFPSINASRSPVTDTEIKISRVIYLTLSMYDVAPRKTTDSHAVVNV